MMTESARSMLGHVALRLRLVYEVDPASNIPSSTDIAGWNLVGLLPEDAPEGAIDDLCGTGDGGVAPNETRAGPAGPVHGGARRRVASEAMVLTLDRDEAEGYYLNLTSPQPSLFALLRVADVASATASLAPSGMPQAEAITASYSEAARWMDGGMVVVRTALPDPLPAWIAEFTEHHFELAGPKKRARNRPSFLSRQQFGDQSRAALGEVGRESGNQEGQGAPRMSPTDTRR